MVWRVDLDPTGGARSEPSRWAAVRWQVCVCARLATVPQLTAAGADPSPAGARLGDRPGAAGPGSARHGQLTQDDDQGAAAAAPWLRHSARPVPAAHTGKYRRHTVTDSQGSPVSLSDGLSGRRIAQWGPVAGNVNCDNMIGFDNQALLVEGI